MRMDIAAVIASLLCMAPVHLFAALRSAEFVDTSDVIVVKGDLGVHGGVDSWRNGFAAEELGRYLSEMSGSQVPVWNASLDPDARYVLVVGGRDENALTRELVGSGAIRLNIPTANGDGFAIRSARAGGKRYLVLAGESPLATLYAVYDYLERFCNVGFFMDGEYVPKAESIPFDVDFSSKPRFEWRQFTATCCGQYGLKKYHYLFKTQQDWDTYFDWLAKRKINMVHWGMAYGTNVGGTADLITYGLDKMVPTKGITPAGWSVGWTYPHEYFTRLSKNVMRFGRNRGMKFIYYFGSGRVPPEVIAAHPEYKYADQYGEKYLHPDDPMYEEYTRRAYRTVITLFGTDHLYMEDPFGETRGGASSLAEALRIKTEAAKKSLRVMREVDPEAVWVQSNWDQIVQTDLWTPKNYEHYLDSFDSKDMIVYECGTDICDRFYAKHGYYHGKNWTLGVLHSYQGDDQLHGDIDGIISKTKEAVEDPDRGNLRGFFNIPETAGHNIMYWQLVTQLAWEPSDITRDGFIVDYCLRRYGAASAPVMEKSIRALVEAVYSGGDWQMAYKRLGCKYGPIDWWPIVDDFEGSVSEYLCKEARIAVGLKKSLDIALTQVKNQSGNPLYENDLIDVAKCYWGHNSNFYIRKAYEAFAESDQREFERNVALSVDMLDRIERLLSTREDYHLQPQIVEVEAYHGSNPHSAFMMKRACVNEQYPNNDVYELFHFYYIPRVKAWAEIVRARMLEEENTVSSRDVMPRWREIEDSWAANPIAVPDDRRLKVTPVQAVLVLYGDEAEDKAILNACAR